jgi:hypothetical protein
MGHISHKRKLFKAVVSYLTISGSLHFKKLFRFFDILWHHRFSIHNTDLSALEVIGHGHNAEQVDALGRAVRLQRAVQAHLGGEARVVLQVVEQHALPHRVAVTTKCTIADRKEGEKEE